MVKIERENFILSLTKTQLVFCYYLVISISVKFFIPSSSTSLHYIVGVEIGS